MPAELPQFAFFLFVVAIIIVAYEMRSSLEPPLCAECPHCRERIDEAERKKTELRAYYKRHYGIREDDNDPRPR